jgi:hypothetical protein
MVKVEPKEENLWIFKFDWSGWNQAKSNIFRGIKSLTDKSKHKR